MDFIPYFQMRGDRASGDEDLGGGNLWRGVEEVRLLKEGAGPDVEIIVDFVGPEEG